jgi:MFS family permease
MEGYTKHGLLLLMIGLLISIISTILTGLYYFMTNSESFSNLIGMIGLGALGAIGGLLALIGGILFLIGRKEFGERHQKFVIYAVIILIVGIIISGVVSGIGVFMSVSQSIANGGDAQFTWTGYSILISTIIGSITGGLAYVLALYELENETGKRILYLAFIVSIILAGIIGYFSMGIIDTLISTISTDGTPANFTSSYAYTSQISQYAVFGIISNLLWLIALYIPYKRIKDGDLIPQKSTVESQQPQRICPNCKKEIPIDTKICPYCGKNFESYV